jgi:hypothetical protein
MNTLTRYLVVTLTVAVATWIGGWWTVAIVALVAGLVLPAGTVAAACASAWLLLLLFDFAAGSVGRLGGVLAGVMGLPAPALVAETRACPARIGRSDASLGMTRRLGMTRGLLQARLRERRLPADDRDGDGRRTEVHGELRPRRRP